MVKKRQRIACVLILLFAFIPNTNAQPVTLLFAGDAMQHQHQLNNAYRNGVYDYSSYFRYLTETISCADIAVVNLETTLGGKPYSGYPLFCSPDEYAVALKEAGFDVFLNANNHILDRFSKGMHRTLDVLDSLEVMHTGVFRNWEERKNTYPLMIERNGIRMAFLNYTYDTNDIEPTSTDIVNYIDRFLMRDDIQRAKFLKADVIIANMHWGAEYKLRQNSEQEQIAQFLIKEGVDIVMGSHPHVVQPAQALTDSTGKISNIIVYSLGNLVSNMTLVNTDGGQMIRIVLDKQKEKPHIVSCHYILVYVDKKQNGNKTDYTIVPVISEASVTANQIKMQLFAQNARAVLDKYNIGVTEDSISACLKPDSTFRMLPLPVKFPSVDSKSFFPGPINATQDKQRSNQSNRRNYFLNHNSRRNQ